LLPDTLPLLPESAPAPAAVPPAERLLLTAADLAQLLGLSLRQIRRLDSSGDLPGRVSGGALGRAVRWRAEVIREWCSAGCPDAAGWQALHGAAQHKGRPKQAGR
jgi:predicted DNA-binding transcriptional regulator AlpA